MGSLVLTGDTSGSVTVAVPAVAGTNTATFPAATGTVMVSGNMPAFSAYQSAGQVISSATWTKVQCQTEDFDTNSAYDNATNYRFQPTVAGYYQVGGSINVPTASRTTEVDIAIYKNGSVWRTGLVATTSATFSSSMSCLIYLNGSTDYAELYTYFAVGGTTVASTSATYFQGCLVRSA